MLRRSARTAVMQSKSIETGKRLAPPKLDTKRKRRKLNDVNEENEIDIVIAPNDRNQSTSILDLNEHCFEEIFEWLSVSDLHSFGNTCTQIQQFAGRHLQCNYPTQSVYFCELCPVPRFCRSADFEGFEEYFKSIIIKMCLNCNDTTKHISDKVIKKRNEQYQYINFYCNPPLKCITFIACTLTACDMNNIRTLLNSVEVLRIWNCIVVDDLHECLLQHCVNLKSLFVYMTTFSKNHKWLRQTYPTIEFFELRPLELLLREKLHINMTQVLQFLEKNPNIRRFTVYSEHLIECVKSKVKSKSLFKRNIQLDELTIKYCGNSEIPTTLLNQLYERGFYKRINLLYTIDPVNWDVNGLGMLGAVICLDSVSDYSNLANIKELWPDWIVDRPRRPLAQSYVARDTTGMVAWLKKMDKIEKMYENNYKNELERLAKCMINLERIWLNKKYVRHSDILPFVKLAPKLKEIFIFEDLETILNLSKLNKNRKRLAGSQKLTIYLNEKQFLMNERGNGRMNLSLIALDRHETYFGKHLNPSDYYNSITL
ncbi:uncharacterized protein LOC116340646 [Contarinia nasturtii]|uniref:uncharacterized protein LOC116340646 n=1 Tax=Contarinia nasturtii TaxID=265458 RepID=UPI0012D3ADAF|nr:uncharacterized protein LOC116340646 [Contarinia nasturtii]